MGSPLLGSLIGFGLALTMLPLSAQGGALPTDGTYGTQAGCLIDVDTGAALDLIETGLPAVLLRGTRMDFPAEGIGCELSVIGNEAFCFDSWDREWFTTFSISLSGTTATVTLTDREPYTLERCDLVPAT